MIITNLEKSINGVSLLKDISFTLNEGDKIGLVGKNGSGKTTLLKILSNDLEKDSGSINLNGETIKLLKQEIPVFYYNYSIIDYLKEDNNLLKLERKIKKLENNLTEENIKEYGEYLEKYLSLDGYNFVNNVEFIKSGLNFDISISTKIKELSGGQKIKVLLASLLLANSDILLLDEPTNNLDLSAIEWLEDYLKKSKKKMIIVSHDEYFLDNITNKTFELENGKLTSYNLKYTDYLSLKEEQYNQELQKYEALEENKKLIKNKLQKMKVWTNQGLSKKSSDNDKIAANYSKERTKNTASKISKLSKELNKLDDFSDFRKKEKYTLSIDYCENKGNKNIYIENMICGYDKFKTPQINLDIPFGSRINISGKNGSGKTTLIKTILKELNPISGNISIGNEVKFGYISQNSLETLDEKLSIYEYLTKDAEVEKNLVFNVLNKFKIDYSEKDKKFNTLSPGQRTRVNLAKLALNKTNVLILDEATNHLDMEAIEILEDVVESFNGTIINISHNRKFNEIMNSNIDLNIENGKVTYIDNEKIRK